MLQYSGEHSVLFGERHSWNDWRLVPTSRPVINEPTVQTNYVDVPGLDGSLDQSEDLSGRPLYSNRTGSIEFLVDPDVPSWKELCSSIAGYLHGKKMRVVLTDDEEYYYYGRLNVSTLRSDKKCSYITIGYEFEPFKRLRFVPPRGGEIVVKGSATVDFPPSEVWESPTFRVLLNTDKDMGVLYKGVYYPLKQGLNKIPGVRFGCEKNKLTFYGNGTVLVNYREERF